MPSLTENQCLAMSEGLFHKIVYLLECQDIYGFPSNRKEDIHCAVLTSMVDLLVSGHLLGFRINQFYLDPVTDWWKWDITLFFKGGETYKLPWYSKYRSIKN